MQLQYDCCLVAFSLQFSIITRMNYDYCRIYLCICEYSRKLPAGCLRPRMFAFPVRTTLKTNLLYIYSVKTALRGLFGRFSVLIKRLCGESV